MNVKILYFAGLREALDAGSESLPLSAEIGTVGALRDFLSARGGAWSALVTTKNLRVAVNQKMVGLDAAVNPGDEVAFFPPVTGG